MTRPVTALCLLALAGYLVGLLVTSLMVALTRGAATWN